MMRMSRRSGGVTVLMMSLCILMTGCMSTSFERTTWKEPNGYPPIQRAGGMPNMPGAGSGLRQAQFDVPGKQPEVIMDGGFGPPSAVHMMPTNPPLPRELVMTTHAPHRVAPPDVLRIEAMRLYPKGPYLLEPNENLGIEVTDTLPGAPIKGIYTIMPNGKINLGYTYGWVTVAGQPLERIEQIIRDHLIGPGRILKSGTVIVQGPLARGPDGAWVVKTRDMQLIQGDHLVRPDGTIYLGLYGSVYVAGMTLGETKATIERHLSAYLIDPQIGVDVKAYNSRRIYIIADTYVNFRQQVITLPATGNETVLDAISQVQGLQFVASTKRIWVARPSPAGHPCSTVLPVDWKAITQAGRTETNYQLLPGDRIYISSDPFWAAYFQIDKVLAPFERILDFTFRTSTTIQSLRGNTNNGVVLIP